MQHRSAQSASRQRLDAQLAQLAELAPDTKVASIKPLPADPGRLSIRIGRAQFGPVNADDIDSLGLSVGAPAAEQARTRLGEAIAREAARTDALRLLRAKARSRQDLIGRLTRKGHERVHAAAAVERLERVGLLDDAALAKDRAERMAEVGRLGPRGAQAKLRTLGLSSPVSTEAVQGAYAGVDLVAQATDAARRRARSMGERLDDETRRRRLYGFLARRGYDHETCRRAVDQTLKGAPDT
jgi:regulatory protein